MRLLVLGYGPATLVLSDFRVSRHASVPTKDLSSNAACPNLFNLQTIQDIQVIETLLFVPTKESLTKGLSRLISKQLWTCLECFTMRGASTATSPLHSTNQRRWFHASHQSAHNAGITRRFPPYETLVTYLLKTSLFGTLIFYQSHIF